MTKCTACALKSKCTPAKERRVKRWEHEAVLEAMQERLERALGSMRMRRQTTEHPFGTSKAWMGQPTSVCAPLEKVSAEMSLHVLPYNLKRMVAVLGAQPLIQAMRAA
jgi:transposase